MLKHLIYYDSLERRWSVRVFVLFYCISDGLSKDNKVMVGVFSSSEEVLNTIEKLKTAMLGDRPDIYYLRFYVISCEVDDVKQDRVYSEHHYFYSDGDIESGRFGKVEHPIK